MSGCEHADRMKLNMRLVMAKAYQGRLVPRSRVTFWLKALAVYYYQTALMYEGAFRFGRAVADMAKSLVLWPFPLTGRQINSTINFVRLRALARICLFRVRRLKVEVAEPNSETAGSSAP